MEPAERYYDGSFFALNDTNKILIDVRGRSFGRTSYWLNKAIKRAIASDNHRFIYLRRKTSEIEQVISDGFAKNMLRTQYYGDYYRKRGLSVETSASKAYVTGKGKERRLIGYLKDLNNIKGVDLDDVDLIIFDEFIATDRSDYKGGLFEPIRFDRFIHTVFRRRRACWVVLLGNPETPTNPYNDFYHIPYKAVKWRDAARGLIYRQGAGATDTGSFAANLSSFDARTYATAVNGQTATQVPDYFIAKKTQAAQYLCAIQYQRTFVTLWIDPVTGLMYAHDNYKIDNTKPLYSAFLDDMSVNASMMIVSQYPQLKGIKQKFYANMFRYNTQATAEKVFDIIDIM